MRDGDNSSSSSTSNSSVTENDLDYECESSEDSRGTEDSGGEEYSCYTDLSVCSCRSLLSCLNSNQSTTEGSLHPNRRNEGEGVQAVPVCEGCREKEIGSLPKFEALKNRFKCENKTSFKQEQEFKSKFFLIF